jgi:ferritin
MLISKQMQAAMNAQIGHELAASNQYVAIACYFDGEGLQQLGKHYFKQAAEERDHAMRFVRFLMDAGADVAIPAVPAPRAKFKDSLDAVKLALDSEMRVTKQINALVDIAVKDKDHLSKNALEWFVNEQREEVASADTLLRMVKRAGEPGLFFVENFLLQGGLAGEGADADAAAE